MDDGWTLVSRMVEFLVLGPLAVRGDDGEALALGPPQRRAVLAVLAVRAGEVVGLDALIDAVWPERPPATAVNIVHGYVAALRSLLEPGRARGEPSKLLQSTPPGYRLVLAPEQSDLTRFERLVDAARRASDPHGRAAAAREGLALWRGQVVADLDGPVFEAARVRLTTLRRRLLAVAVESDLELGRHAELVPELEALLAEDPLAEDVRAQLMRALYGVGRQADALAVFDAGRRELAARLGLDPGPELRAAQRAVLSHDPALRRAPAPYPVRLPATVGSFVGRVDDLGVIRDRLRTDRLVTLTGPGGVGKTRLAIEAARSSGFDGGMWFVDLVPADRPEAVTSAVASTVGVRSRPGEPLLESLIAHLEGARCLVVLDNCEHVIDAAADLVSAVLAACPHVHVLATSREALRVAGERMYAVPALPDEEATELFSQRAAVNGPTDPLARTAVARLCRQVDGLPLAIELVAARATALSLPEIATRLGDQLAGSGGPGRRGGPARHRSIRAVIDWSYQMLGPAEQRLLDRLGVFAADFGLEAAEYVGEPEEDVAALIGRLVDTSLVLRGEGPDGRSRYRLLDTVRGFARDRLADGGATLDTRRRHVAHFATVAEQLTPLGGRPTKPGWLDRLDQERAELRSAAVVAFDDEPALTDDGVRLVAAAWLLWSFRGPVEEGRTLTEAALRHADAAPPRTRLSLLYGVASTALAQGDLARTAEAAGDCLHLAEATRDDLAIGWGAGALGLAHWASGEYEPGRELTERGVAASRRAGDLWSTAIGLAQLGRVASDRDGEAAAAAGLLDEAVALARASGEDQAIGFALDLSATLALRQGDDEQAAVLAEQALTAYRAGKVHEGAASALRTIGRAAIGRSDRLRAVTACRERVDLCERHGFRGAVAACLEDVAELTVFGLSPAVAVRLLAAATKLRAAHGTPPAMADQPGQQRALASLHEVMSPAEFGAGWTAGEQAELGEVLRLARTALSDLAPRVSAAP